ncbi:MAG TPA: hypothetical protein VM778_14840 [Gemmatimonadota bacterium]|nr:hypothetical protein [Gemmatimonadota bacterium]
MKRRRTGAKAARLARKMAEKQRLNRRAGVLILGGSLDEVRAAIDALY